MSRLVANAVRGGLWRYDRWRLLHIGQSQDFSHQFWIPILRNARDNADHL